METPHSVTGTAKVRVPPPSSAGNQLNCFIIKTSSSFNPCLNRTSQRLPTPLPVLQTKIVLYQPPVCIYPLPFSSFTVIRRRLLRQIGTLGTALSDHSRNGCLNSLRRV